MRKSRFSNGFSKIQLEFQAAVGLYCNRLHGFVFLPEAESALSGGLDRRGRVWQTWFQDEHFFPPRG
jgi:hypothetical protein